MQRAETLWGEVRGVGIRTGRARNGLRRRESAEVAARLASARAMFRLWVPYRVHAASFTRSEDGLLIVYLDLVPQETHSIPVFSCLVNASYGKRALCGISNCRTPSLTFSQPTSTL